MKLVQDGMEDAAAKYDVTLLKGNSWCSLTNETSLINDYIDQKVDAICITPLDHTNSVPALQNAKNKGIKIVTFNTTIDGDISISSILTNMYDLGAKNGTEAKNYITTNLSGKNPIKVATLAFHSALPIDSDARVNGFLDQIKDLPGVTVVAQEDAWLVDQATTTATNIINIYPDLAIFYGANDGGTKGSTIAVKNTGKVGSIVVFGIDYDQQIRDFLVSSDNILQAVVGQSPYQQGYRAVEIAVKAIEGETVEKNILIPGILYTRSNPDGVE